GVLAVGFGRRRQRQDVIFGVVPDRVDPGDGGLAFGQGAGFIEQYRIHGAHRFQRQAIFDQHPATGRTFGGNGDHQRNGEAQGVRTGNDQHGDGAYYVGVGHAQHGPHQRGNYRSPWGDPEEPACGGAGDALGFGWGGLGVGAELLDPRQRGVFSDGGDFDSQAGICGHSAGQDVVVLPASDG